MSPEQPVQEDKLEDADTADGNAVVAQEGRSSSTSEKDLHDSPPATTASISMSAGADPWADPPPAVAMASGSKKTGGENPWASNTPDLGGSESFTDADRAEQGEGRGADQQNERWGEFHLPKLGNTVARYWSFKSGFLLLNNGAYGACPKPVCDAYKAIQDRQEENINLFRHMHMKDLLGESRAKVAKVLNCPVDNVVLIANSSTGTNAVLRDLVFENDDAILFHSMGYGAVEKNINYLIDTERMRGNRLHKVVVPLTMPTTKQEILRALETTIEETRRQGKRIRIAIVDTIASKPALRLPWEDMVKVLRERQILSLVDGAHGIGQIPINLSEADPDFFVSNCHKWMYAHRGCAVFYTASRNFHLQRSSLPTGWFYTSNPSQEANTWVQQWGLTGTLDVSPLLSVDAALEFRQKMGGEERIMSYNHDLAIRGGKAAAAILDTCLLDSSPDFFMTASMVNVQLPIIKSRLGPDVALWMSVAEEWFSTSLQHEFKTALPVYQFQEKIWARFSAEIWLEVHDFEYGARALLELSKRINEGTAPDFRPSRGEKGGKEEGVVEEM